VSPRRALAAVALAALVAACIEPRLLRMPFIDRDANAWALALSPDRQWPQFPRFLEGVRQRTQPGDTIALLVPPNEWYGGYSQMYFRASYFLTGREVLPLMDPRSAPAPENFAAARYVAAFGVALPAPAEVVWQGEGGTLYRR
jgi:hypothetical protein